MGEAFQIGPPQVVLRLADRLPAQAWTGWPIGFTEAAGRLWIGANDGQVLFVEPFHDAISDSRVVAAPVWTGSAPLRLRARTSGPWMLLWSDHGLKAINLLTLDDPELGQLHAGVVWDLPEGHRLVSDPILLRPDNRGGPERLACWVSSGPDGLVFWRAILSFAAAPVAVANMRLVASEEAPLVLRGREDRVALVAAPFRRRDCALLCTSNELWFIRVPLTSEEVPPALTLSLVGRRHRFLINAHAEMPGVVFVPGAGSKEADALGTIFVCHQEPAGEQVLTAFTITSKGVSTFPETEAPGIPVDQIDGREVLCLARDQLVRFNPLLGQPDSAGSNLYLAGASRIHAYGRVVVCTGLDASSGRSRWFILIMDWVARKTVSVEVMDRLAAHPVVLGPYLFTLEPPGTEGRMDELCLIRRKLTSAVKPDGGA